MPGPSKTTRTLSRAHSPTFPPLHLVTTLPSLYLRHSSFSNTSVASRTSHFILQPFFRFSYVTSSSHNSPGEPPMSETPRKPTQTPFRPHRNPHEVTETRTRDPSAAVGGERLTACATRPPKLNLSPYIVFCYITRNMETSSLPRLILATHNCQIALK